MSASVEAISRDRAFILDPDKWPKWPVLPLMRRDYDAFGKDAAGFILPFSGKEARPAVYLGVIYMLDAIADAIRQQSGNANVTWDEIVLKLEKITYDSLDALLVDWRVD
jgi:hypothetical protein